jgi:rod shape-determining protein MreD
VLGGVQTYIVRATLLVGVAALLEVTLSPLLAIGWVGPRFLVLGVVIAVAGLRELQALLLGFFGGVLMDALSGGLFGVGALGGAFTAAISVRAGTVRRKGQERLLLAQEVAVAVAVYDLLSLFAPILAGQNMPPISSYLIAGVIPDVILNAVLAYLVGVRLRQLISVKEERWT